MDVYAVLPVLEGLPRRPERAILTQPTRGVTRFWGSNFTACEVGTRNPCLAR